MGMKFGNAFMSTAGYAEYRYGTGKKPTLSPVWLEKRGPHERSVDGVVAALKRWRLSPFENEAQARYALRNYLLADGSAWEHSDVVAAATIEEAFRLIGAKRPSWFEGQREHAGARVQCLWCGGLIDDEDQVHGRRFCSVLCAKSCRLQRSDRASRHTDYTYQRALIEIMDANGSERPCKACSKPFRSRFRATEYCSRECFAIVRRLPDRSCLSCSEVFKPSDHTKKYCCKTCAYEGIAKDREWRLPEVCCTVCRAIFRPKTTSAMYCSKRCSMSAKNAGRRKARSQSNIIHLTPEIFDSWFRIAA